MSSPNIYWHSFTNKDRNVYIIGGATFPISTVTNTVYLGRINDAGKIKEWINLTPLPKQLALSAVATTDKKIYVSGGFGNGFVMNKEVYMANIHSDGTIGSWENISELPLAVEGHALIEHNNHLILIGGRNLSTGYTNKAYISEIKSDGSIGAWIETTPLPISSARAGIVKAGNRVFWIGGELSGGNTSNIYYTTINSDNTIGDWMTSDVGLPQPICCGAATIVGNFLYYTGGHNEQDYINNVYVSELSYDSQAPTEIELQVNLLKQTDTRWGNEIYDHAKLWNPNTLGIKHWGCAITSTTMILNYHGLTKISKNKELNPSTLNEWLVKQPDGYLGNGRLNWLAVSRLSKQIKQFNPMFSFEALEYQKIQGMNNEQLTTDLISSMPGILEVPGHFVVAKGILNNSFIINDPFYERTLLSEGYNNEYLSLGRYIPSNTDLSYIMIVTDNNVNLILKNESGEAVGDVSIQHPVIDPISKKADGIAMKTLYFPKPESGEYKIEITAENHTRYNLEIFSYDIKGNVKKSSNIGFIDQSSIDNYYLSYKKENVKKVAVNNIISFESFYTDIKVAHEMKLIQKISMMLLTTRLKDIETDYIKKKKGNALMELSIMDQIIKKLPKNEVDDSATKIFLEDTQGLKNYINSK